jgi:tripartite-type tricarboxylate transporter receptor subunit TctC
VDAISLSSSWGPLVESGKFRLLATYVEQRSARYAQAPTLKEVGYDVAYLSPLGIVGPKGMPKPVVHKLHDAFQKAMDDPEFLAIIKKFDMFLLYLNPDEAAKADRQESEKIGKIVQKLGLQKQ